MELPKLALFILLFNINIDFGLSYFEDYICVSERAVSIQLWRESNNATGRHEVGTKEECFSKCEAHHFIFYRPQDMQHQQSQEMDIPSNVENITSLAKNIILKENCYCFQSTSWESEFIVRVNVFQETDFTNFDCKDKFLLSCRVDDKRNWCKKLDESISYDFHSHEGRQFEEDFYPKCLDASDINFLAMKKIEIEPGQLHIRSRDLKCNQEDNRYFTAAQEDSTYCGKFDAIKPQKRVIEVSDKCMKCQETLNRDAVDTCGSSKDNVFSLYCSICSNATAACFTLKVATNKFKIYQEHRLDYFGCFSLSLDREGEPFEVDNSDQCFQTCYKRSPYLRPQMFVYIKPSKNHKVLCLCQEYKENITRLPTVADISSGCEETWCPPTPGPCGSLREGNSGFSLYCQYTGETNLCTEVLGNPDNFYPNSPAKYMHLETTTPSGCRECPGRYDERGHYWSSACAGDVMTADCPDNTTGITIWTCDNNTLNFIPEQPDRTNCCADWLEDVESMSRNGTHPKNITEEILDHLSTENITSGTLIRLVQVGVNLTQEFNKYRTHNLENIEDSRLITQDLVQITSDLFNQSIAWVEMEEVDQAFQTFQLILSNEMMAYKHLGYIAETENQSISDNPYIDDSIVDSRKSIGYFLSSVERSQVDSGIPPWLSIIGDSWRTEVSGEETWKIYGATYSAGTIPSNIVRSVNSSEFIGGPANLTFNSNPAIISFSLNNESTVFNGSYVRMIFNHENESLACPGCQRVCVSWNYTTSMFTSQGCTTGYSDRSKTECECSHLTNFGLIFDITNAFEGYDETQTQILSYMSIFLCSTSCLFSMLTFVVLQTSKLPSSPRVSIVKNRSVSLFGLYFLFLVGFDKEQFDIPPEIQDTLCAMFAILLHFFGLATFTWTLLEGIQLNKSIQSNVLTDIDTRKYTMLLRYLVGYGTPLIIITITLAWTYIIGSGESAYNNLDKYCWLRGNDFIYAFVGPAACVIIFNFYVFIKTVRVATIARRKFKNSITDKIMSQLKSWLILSFLLGVTWVLGFLIQDGLEWIGYFFVLLNGSSGIFIFIHSVINNDVIMQELKIRFGLEKNEKLAINNSGSRLNAVMSFKRAERPKIRKRSPRPRTRSKMDSTSSEDVQNRRPPPPRRNRKLQRKPEEYYNSGHITSDPTTPDNTSVGSVSTDDSNRHRLPKRLQSEIAGHQVPRNAKTQFTFEDEEANSKKISEMKNRLKHRHSNKW